MLQVWIDDSGTDQEPAFVLAGYVGRVGPLESFADDWQRLLKERPVLDYVKGEEAHHRRNQFQGWPIEQRDARWSCPR